MNDINLTHKQTKDVSIILPVFNEKKCVLPVIREIQHVMDQTDYNYEIIAVDDYSTDGARAILHSIESIRVVEHPYNKGYGNSLKTGITNAKYNTIVMLDSDGTYLPQDIPKLLKHADNYDLVSGARIGKHVRIPFLRRPAKFILTTLANILTGMRIPDINCGLRVMKKDNVIKFFYLLPPRFSFTITHLLACLSNDYNVKFVPINYLGRKDSSTIHPIKDFLRFLNIIVRIVTYFKPFKMFSMFSFFMMLVAIIVWLYTFFVSGRIADMTVLILALSSVQIFLFGLLADIVVKASNKN